MELLNVFIVLYSSQYTVHSVLYIVSFNTVLNAVPGIFHNLPVTLIFNTVSLKKEICISRIVTG